MASGAVPYAGGAKRDITLCCIDAGRNGTENMVVPLESVNVSTYIRNNLQQRTRQNGATELYVNIYGIRARVLIRFVEYCWFGRLEMAHDHERKPSRYMTRQQELSQKELLEAWLAGDSLGATDFQNQCLKQLCSDRAAEKPWVLSGPKLVWEQTQNDPDSLIRSFVVYLFAHGPTGTLFSDATEGLYPYDFLRKVLVTMAANKEQRSDSKKLWLRLASDLGQFTAKTRIDLTQEDVAEEDYDMTEAGEVAVTPPEQPESSGIAVQPNAHRTIAPTPDGNGTISARDHRAPASSDRAERSTNNRFGNAYHTYPDRSVRGISVDEPSTPGHNPTASTRNRRHVNRGSSASNGPNWLHMSITTQVNARDTPLFHTPPRAVARATPAPSIPDSVVGGDDDDGDDEHYVHFCDHAWCPPRVSDIREDSYEY